MVAAALAVSQTMYATRSVTLSEFTATPAEVTASLPDGHVEFTVSFKVENTGDEAINPGDEDYRFTIGQFNFSGSLTDSFAEINGTEAIESGASVTVTAPCSYNLADFNSDYTNLTIKVKEYISNSVMPQYAFDCPKVKVLSPVAKFAIKEGSSTVSEGKVIDFGVVTVSADKTFTISNTGRSLLTVDAVTFKDLDGVTTSAQLPVGIEPGESKDLTITFAGKTLGKKGTVTVKYDNAKEEKEFSFIVKGAVIGENAWIEGFNDARIPDGWDNVAAEGSTGSNPWSTRTVNSNPIAEQGNNTNMQLLVTPLMKVDPAQSIVFQAGHSYISNASSSVLTVLYSTDRENWTELGVVKKVDEGTRLPFNTFNWADVSNNVLEWYNIDTKKMTAGDYYFAFRAGQCMLDNIYGLAPAEIAQDMKLESFTLPETGMVNYEFEGNAAVRNMLGTAVAADSYKVALFDGDTKVADGESVEIPAYGTVIVKLPYTSHLVGENTLRAELTYGEKTLSAEATINIEEESTEIPVKIGDVAGYSNADPYNTDSYASSVQAIYTAEDLNLESGSEITALSIPGYFTSAYSNTKKFTISIESTDKDAYTADDTAITASAADAVVYDADMTFTQATADAPVNYTFTFTKPFVYNGGNICLTITRAGGFFSSLYLAYAEASANRGIYMKKAYYSSAEAVTIGNKVPAVIFSVPQEPVNVTAVVKHDGVAASGAQVSLESDNNVKYSATADETGAVKIPVIQLAHSYALNIVHGEKTYVHPSKISLADKNDLDLGEIEIGTSTAIAELGADAQAMAVSAEGGEVTVSGRGSAIIYSTDGRTVAASAVDGAWSCALESGVYIVETQCGATRNATKIAIR